MAKKRRKLALSPAFVNHQSAVYWGTTKGEVGVNERCKRRCAGTNESQWDDLTRPLDVDFTVVFPNESAAREFAEHFRGLGHQTSVEFSGTVAKLPWDVIVVKHMVLSQEDIERFEDTIRAVASSLDGRNDGWGCFSEP